MSNTNLEKNQASGQSIVSGIFEAGHAAHDLVPAADGPTPIEGRLRKAPLRVPDNYEECTGFTLFGRRIRTLLYSTDVAAIRNSNADAIFAVYPFTAQPAITQALLTVAEAPLFVGVGGGTTTGRRAAELAAVSEMQGAAGVVLNSPATPETVAQVVSTVDIPVVATVGCAPDGFYNINADVAAGKIAEAMGADKLIYLTDVDGLYEDVDDEDSLIQSLSRAETHELLESGRLDGGMLPKIRSISEALDAGVSEVVILNGTFPHSLLLEIFTDAGCGTMFTQDEFE